MKYLIITTMSLLSFSNCAFAAAKDTSFKMIDTELGVTNQDYHIQDDTQRLSLLAHTQSDLSKAMDYYSFELSYALRVSNIWVEAFLAQTNATFSALFADQDATTGITNSEASEKLLTGGIGLGYRFNVIQELLSGEKWYETVQSFLTYSILDESQSGERFQGFGWRADYGVHYRSDHKTHYGARLSYHVSSLVRGALDETENRSDRSLTSGVLSLAFEYGIYY